MTGADEDEMRQEFARQHEGRNLSRHKLRGTYSNANIAALWNQHRRTANWILRRVAAANASEAEQFEAAMTKLGHPIRKGAAGEYMGMNSYRWEAWQVARGVKS